MRTGTAASAGLTAGWAQMRREINGSEQTLFITEIGGETQTPAGSAMTVSGKR